MSTARRIAILIIIAAIPFFISGCWDKVDIEKTDFILGLAVDPAGEDDLRVTVCIPTAVASGAGGAGGGAGALTSLHVTGQGKTIMQALVDVQQQLEFTIYLGRLMVVAVSEDVARRGLMPIWDTLLREHYISARLILVVVPGTAAKLIEATPAEEPLAAKGIWNTVNSMGQQGNAPTSFLIKTITDYFDPGIEPAVVMLEPVPAVQTTGGRPPGKGSDSSSSSTEISPADATKASVTYRYAGLAMFKGDRMVGKLDPVQARAATLLAMGHPGARWEVPLDGGSVSVELTRIRREFQFRVENDQVYIDVGLTILVKVVGSTSGLNFANPGAASKLMASLDQYFSKVIGDTIALSQAVEADIFGFGLRMQAKDYRDFVKLDWDQAYPKAKITVHVNTLLLEQGRWHGEKGP